MAAHILRIRRIDGGIAAALHKDDSQYMRCSMFKEKERSGNLLACVGSKSNYVSEIAHYYKIKQYFKVSYGALYVHAKEVSGVRSRRITRAWELGFSVRVKLCVGKTKTAF